MNAQQDDLVLCAVDGGVATLTLNRPDHGNAWNGALGQRYFSLLDEVARDRAVRAIVVTGAGRAFCIGGDGAALSDAVSAGGVEMTNSYPYWHSLRIAKPIIAAVNGACFGIGMQQALCCDIRFAADDVKFATAYARRGLVAEYGMSWLLPRIVGAGHAMDMLLSARLIRAAEAEKMGLANRIAPAADLLTQAQAYARDLVTLCAPSSLAAIKRQALLDLEGTLPESYARSEAALTEALAGEDFKEGVRSWQEQRPPTFPPLPAHRALLDLN
jgi:enoyl-CoA hydratase/carnithine racemase